MFLPEKYESIFDVSSKGPSSGSLVNKVYLGPCLLNFPTKGLCSKRRRYFHIFQVEAYPTCCEDIIEILVNIIQNEVLLSEAEAQQCKLGAVVNWHGGCDKHGNRLASRNKK